MFSFVLLENLGGLPIEWVIILSVGATLNDSMICGPLFLLNVVIVLLLVDCSRNVPSNSFYLECYDRHHSGFLVCLKTYSSSSSSSSSSSPCHSNLNQYICWSLVWLRRCCCSDWNVFLICNTLPDGIWWHECHPPRGLKWWSSTLSECLRVEWDTLFLGTITYLFRKVLLSPWFSELPVWWGVCIRSLEGISGWTRIVLNNAPK